MHTALVTAWGSAPQYTSTPTPPSPASPNTVRIRVLAAGLHQVVRSRAAGKHYSSGALPHIPGADGVGELVTTGQKVYFVTLSEPGAGSMTEFVDVPARAAAPLPEGADPRQIAAYANPMFSSWMALAARVSWEGPRAAPREGWTCVILGVTSASGRVAVAAARAFGAARVVGVARNEAAMAELGLDAAVVLRETVDETDWTAVGSEVDVVLDYLYGPPAESFLKSLKSAKPVQYVQIGMLAGAEIVLPGALLRSKDFTMRGAGMGSWRMHELKEQVPKILEELVKLGKMPVRVEPLSNVESVWQEETNERIVFVP